MFSVKNLLKLQYIQKQMAHSETGGSDQEHNLLQKYGIIFLLIIAITARLSLWLVPKEPWLDECMIAMAIHQAPWFDLLQGKLTYNQSCPIMFAIWGKLLAGFTSYSPRALYILPTVAGIGLLGMMALFTYKYSRSYVCVLACVFLMSIFKMPLYYSSEFKQYIVEALVTVILFYEFLKDYRSGSLEKFLSYKYPAIISISILFSTTAVFIAFSLGLTIFLYVCSLKKMPFFGLVFHFAKKYFLCVVFFIAYYFLYLKQGNSAAMQKYWEPYLIPLDFSQLGSYITKTFIPLIKGMFTVEYVNISIVLGCLFVFGIFAVWKKDKVEGLAFTLPFLIAFALAFGPYPLGLGGMIGSRLSMYLFPLVVIISSIGLFYIFNTIFSFSTIKVQTAIILALIVFCTLINMSYIQKNMNMEVAFSYHKKIHADFNKKNIFYIESRSIPKYKYWCTFNRIKPQNYISLDRNHITNKSFDKIFKNTPKDKELYILSSHPFRNSWKNRPLLIKYLENNGYYVDSSRERGSFLLRCFPKDTNLPQSSDAVK